MVLSQELLYLFFIGICSAVVKCEEHQTYIVHMDHSQKPASFSTHESWHRSSLKSLSTPVLEKDFLYSYDHVMHGFSARLTISQLAEIESFPANVVTSQESFGKLFTTYSPKFLGLNSRAGIWPTASYGEGVIIGIIDSGIWPESESFSDRGMPEVPRKWKGQCENGTAFSPSSCNRKLIGARFFTKGLIAAGRNISWDLDYNSTRDFFGHGTHTSSTAAGNHVLGASHFGYARGTARGVAPRAHLAMYKVLFVRDTMESAATDVLAGMDKAIEDGVDIMSLSLGFDQTPYFQDVIAIASLSAAEKGISVVCASGNDGSFNSTHNGAPWITTVGAGTLDRSFTATISRSDGLIMEGTSYFPDSVYITDTPFYYGPEKDKAKCNFRALNKSEVHGRIVICDNSLETDVEGQIEELERVGAYAGILTSDPPLVVSPSEYSIPVLVISKTQAASLKNNMTKIAELTANIKFVSTKLGKKQAPQVAFFSSRGPDPVTPGVLKPDIIAPGVDVLAAFPPNKLRMEIRKYSLATDYTLLSGTSMAAPHVAGVAALLKKVHPEWSPATIRSAIMTTAYTTDNNHTAFQDQWTGLATTPLAFGAGHINPNKAMKPGLVYDISFQDYVNFICSLGYTNKQISAILRRTQWSCAEQSELNYPSFIAIFNNQNNSTYREAMNFSRVLTNVGDDASTYTAVLEIPAGIRITVEPSTLYFGKKFQKLGFSMSVSIEKEDVGVTYGYIRWIDQHNHVVSSPIVVVNS